MTLLVPEVAVFNVMTCGSRAVFLLPHEVPRETLQACFLLKLQPAMPVTLPFVAKLQEITGGEGLRRFISTSIKKKKPLMLKTKKINFLASDT